MYLLRSILIGLVVVLLMAGCKKIKPADSKNKLVMTTDTTNPLLCDIETGVCATPEDRSTNTEVTENPTPNRVKVIYFTDPICSSCWGIEPQLRKLKLEYGELMELEYRMGGLLPDWSYNSGGISKPSDVAHHWDEVSLHYDMPIDGDVWLEDPLDSSYPPSIAFKAAQMQSNAKAVIMLRKLRELLFLQKKNITKWPFVEQAAIYAGLDVPQLKTDYEGAARTRFQEDLAYAKQLNVRGFPTMFFIHPDQQMEVVYGARPYAVYEAALAKKLDGASKKPYDHSWNFLFAKYPSLTVREYTVLSGLDRASAEAVLEKLFQEKKIQKISTKNGALYSLEQEP